MMFRDQVGVLASWFKGWNECEQTVALLSLLKRVSRTQARFLQLCLEHSLAECTELQVLEGEANNPGECRGFCVVALETAAPAMCPNFSKLLRAAQIFCFVAFGKIAAETEQKDLKVDAEFLKVDGGITHILN